MSNLNPADISHDCRCGICSRDMSADIADAKHWKREYDLKSILFAGVYDKLASILKMLPWREADAIREIEQILEDY